MKLICSYCRKIVGEKEPLGNESVSHGMRLECYDYFIEQVKGLSINEFLDRFDVPVLIVSEEGRMVAANESALQMTGRSKSEFIGLCLMREVYLMKKLFTRLVLGIAIVVASSIPVRAEAPKYDATGTWAYELTKRWDTCSPDSTFDDSGTAVLTQAGISITLYIPGQSKTLFGTVEGNRYWVSQWAETQGGGKKNEQAVFVLQSATIGQGHFLGAWSDGESNCNWGGNLRLKKLLSTGCQPSDTEMCLRNGRYSVSVTWKDQTGKTGVGHTVPSTDDSGLFWFFSSSNMELLVKVLNGCSINNRYWVFFAATTDQEFTVTVTDTKTGLSEDYTNPLKNPADAVTDTDAFATCP